MQERGPLDEYFKLRQRVLYQACLTGIWWPSKLPKVSSPSLRSTAPHPTPPHPSLCTENATSVEQEELLAELELMRTMEPHENILNLLGQCTTAGMG